MALLSIPFNLRHLQYHGETVNEDPQVGAQEEVLPPLLLLCVTREPSRYLNGLTTNNSTILQSIINGHWGINASSGVILRNCWS